MYFLKSNASLTLSDEAGNIFILNMQAWDHISSTIISTTAAEIEMISKYKILEENRKIKQLNAEIERLKNVKKIEEDKMNWML